MTEENKKNQSQKEKIAAVVVTYNRKGLLKECLDALLNQTHPLDSIILIDNASTDGTPEFLKEKGYLDNPKIDYVRLSENTGGAGGFHEGVKRGYEKGYDWLWLMDDDALPEKSSLNNLLDAKETFFKNNEKIGIIGSVAMKKNNYSSLSWILSFNGYYYKTIFDLSDITQVGSLPFLGVLISKSLINKIGYPEKDYFLWYDDVEYCYRAKKNGEKIFVVKNSIVYHPISSETKEVKLPFNKKIFVKPSSSPPWKDYYDIRNNIFFIKKYKFGIKKYLSLLFLILFSLIKRDQKIKRVKYYIKGIIDGFLNRGGKRV